MHTMKKKICEGFNKFYNDATKYEVLHLKLTRQEKGETFENSKIK